MVTGRWLYVEDALWGKASEELGWQSVCGEMTVVRLCQARLGRLGESWACIFLASHEPCEACTSIRGGWEEAAQRGGLCTPHLSPTKTSVPGPVLSHSALPVSWIVTVKLSDSFPEGKGGFEHHAIPFPTTGRWLALRQVVLILVKSQAFCTY